MSTSEHGSNLERMGLFPDPDTLRDKIGRPAAILATYYTLEASRAAVDEIMTRTPDLTEDDRYELSKIAEQLDAKAEEIFSKYIDK